MIRLIKNSGDSKRIQHFIKVHSFTKLIGEMKGMSKEELDTLQVAALVHDIGIKKVESEFGSSNGKLQGQLGADIARKILSRLNYSKEEKEMYLL